MRKQYYTVLCESDYYITGTSKRELEKEFREIAKVERQCCREALEDGIIEELLPVSYWMGWMDIRELTEDEAQMLKEQGFRHY